MSKTAPEVADTKAMLTKLRVTTEIAEARSGETKILPRRLDRSVALLFF